MGKCLRYLWECTDHLFDCFVHKQAQVDMKEAEGEEVGGVMLEAVEGWAVVGGATRPRLRNGVAGWGALWLLICEKKNIYSWTC